MDGESYTKANLTGPLVLVIGAEGKGLGRLVKENCDIIVSLPMQGGVNSLNAAAAGAFDCMRLCASAARGGRKCVSGLLLTVTT